MPRTLARHCTAALLLDLPSVAFTTTTSCQFCDPTYSRTALAQDRHRGRPSARIASERSFGEGHLAQGGRCGPSSRFASDGVLAKDRKDTYTMDESVTRSSRPG